MDVLLRALALVFFVLAALAGAVLARGHASQRPGFARLESWPLLLIAGGFLAHCAGLYFIGLEIHRCPLTNLSQVFGFLGWSVVLLYLVIGPTYRLSLFGTFTAPLAALLLGASLLLPDPRVPADPTTLNPWVEFHAATGILSYGAFCLAGIAGVLVLMQDRQLKSGRPAALFFRLPAIAALSSVNVRLLIFGFALLTAGIAGGFVSGVRSEDVVKIGWAIAVWLVYACILGLCILRTLAPRPLGLASVGAVLFTVSSLVGFHYLHFN
jgi:HemX protein